MLYLAELRAQVGYVAPAAKESPAQKAASLNYESRIANRTVWRCNSVTNLWPEAPQSRMRCFNSQTRKAASRRAFVRVRLPTAAISRSLSWCALPAALPFPRAFRFAFELRARRAGDPLTDALPVRLMMPEV